MSEEGLVSDSWKSFVCHSHLPVGASERIDSFVDLVARHSLGSPNVLEDGGNLKGWREVGWVSVGGVIVIVAFGDVRSLTSSLVRNPSPLASAAPTTSLANLLGKVWA